jgi:hypothetical protein
MWEQLNNTFHTVAIFIYCLSPLPLLIISIEAESKEWKEVTGSDIEEEMWWWWWCGL